MSAPVSNTTPLDAVLERLEGVRDCGDGSHYRPPDPPRSNGKEEVRETS